MRTTKTRITMEIEERVLDSAIKCIEEGKTVREIAKEIGMSKSTVHKDLTKRLVEMDASMAEEVREVLNYHLSIRALHGGQATKRKYISNGN